MNGNLNRHKRRSEEINKFSKFMQHSDMLNVIHYSCESIAEDFGSRSPRITSIGIRNLGSGQTTSFSIHLMAERKRLDLSTVQPSYDILEREMLDEFYDFVRRNERSKWIHWNMRDGNYGFPAIAHRYRVLGGIPSTIPDENLFDLAEFFKIYYGSKYIGHRRLTNLCKHNGLSMIDFLEGKDEAQAFVEQNYLKLHRSTLRKINLISELVRRQWEGKLKTQSKIYQRYGLSVTAWLEGFSNSIVYKLLGAFGIIYTVYQALNEIF